MTFKIGDFSRLTQVSVKALRHYDELGLLKPASQDPFTGYRYYAFDQLPRLNRILALKDLGLSLEQIARLLEQGLPPEQLRGMLRLKQAELQMGLHLEQARLLRVEAKLRQIEQEGKMPSQDVIIKRVAPLRVAAIRGVIPSYPEQGGLWQALDGYLARRKVNPVGPCLTIYHDFEYREYDVDVEVAEPVPGSPPEEGQVRVYDLPAVEAMACVLHHGDFHNMGETYGALTSWIGSNGYRIVGPNREVYLRAVGYPSTQVQYPPEYLTGADSDRLTEIQFPVEKTR